MPTQMYNSSYERLGISNSTKVVSSDEWFLVLHVLFNNAQPVSNMAQGGLVIQLTAGELAWQYIAMIRNNLRIISISLMKGFHYVNKSSNVETCNNLEDEICNGGPKYGTRLLNEFRKCLKPCRMITYKGGLI